MFRLALSAFRLASAFCASACLHRTVSLRSGRGGGGGPEGAKCSRQWSLRGTYSGESSLDAPGKVEPAAWAGGAGRAALATAAARSPTACRRPPRVCAALAWTCIQPWSWWRGLLPVLLPLPPALLLLRVCGSARTRSDRELDCERPRWGCKLGVQGWEPPAQNGGGLFARPFPQSEQSLRSFQRRVRATVVRFGIQRVSARGGAWRAGLRVAASSAA